MIKVKRLAEPNSLKNNWRQWNIDYAIAATKAERAKLENRYRQKDVKKTLGTMFNGKCAYCESIINVVDYPHIEHFRPKERYPERMYLWKNMLLSCPKCNGKEFKGTKFPSSAENGPLLNPCIDDPCDHFEFEYNVHTRQARVIPCGPRGITTEKTLGLNRPDLLKARSDFLRKLIFIRIKADHDPEAKEIIENTLNESSPYLAFIRKYIQPLEK